MAHVFARKVFLLTKIIVFVLGENIIHRNNVLNVQFGVLNAKVQDLRVFPLVGDFTY